MRALLSLVLSFCIVFSSVSPSFAQFARGGRAVIKGLTRPAVPGSLQSQVARLMQFQRPASVLQIRALMNAGTRIGVAERIFKVPAPAERASLLRNEFVTLTLEKHVLPEQLGKAVSFYRTDLESSSEAFASFADKDFSAALSAAQDAASSAFTDFFACRDALSDAAALGLFGSKADVQKLVAFYEKAKGSAFEDVAAAITARGMLRQGAYEELTAWAKENASDNFFWSELASYTEAKGLPVELAVARNVPAKAPSSGMREFLRQGLESNALNADFSRAATEEWMALGSRPAAQPAAAEEQALSAATPAELSSPVLSVKLPELELPNLNLTVTPGSIPLEAAPSVPAPQETVPTQQQEGTVQFFAKNQASPSSSGMLYGGLPFPEMVKAFKGAVNWLRKRFGKRKRVAPYEEPGLHDDTQIREVYNNLRSPENPASADELVGANETGPVPVSESGFKLTRVDGNGVERILPVNLEISNRFRVKGYNRIAFAANPDFQHGYVAELRNQEKEPLRMSHFYMRLQENQVGELVDLVRAAGLEKFSLKLESTPDVNYKTITLPVYDMTTGLELPLKVDMPLKSYPAGSKIVLMENGALGLLNDGASQPVALSGFYVRLPKNQIRNFVEILRNSPTVFNVSVHPTRNRADLIMRDASLTNISLGKTMGPVVNNALGISVRSANSMMFTINYILPGLASLLTPVLKKYGEKNLMVLSLAMSTAAGVLASVGGFYGFVEGMALGPVSKGLFITALFLMSGSSILKQLVSNMLIRANRGEVILDAAKTAVKKSQTEFTAMEKQGFKRIGERLKEFFTKKSDVSLKDVVLYNLSFVYKNVGTLAFLASPYLINHGIRLATGVDLGLDYSISFPIYAVYSGAVAWKVWRAKLRDAYSVKNLEQSRVNLDNVLDSGAKALASVKGKLSGKQIDEAARRFKDALDALVFADVKLDPGKKRSDLYKKAKSQFLADLEAKLAQEHGLSGQQAQAIVSQVKSSLAVQENTIGNMLKMLKAPGVPALTSAMTLATIHEFVVSSSFASTMKMLINQGEFANFLIACSLYVPLIAGRLGGNIISRRISADTMYILCSALSGVGTAVMATAGDSVSQMIAGAAVASFGVGNFFTQMYDYIMSRYPKQNRELSSILALTMAFGGIGAIPAGYLAAATGFEASALLYAGAALGASLLLTPGMMANSTIVQGVKYEFKRIWQGVKKVFKRGGNNTPGNLDNAAPVN